MPFFRRPDGRLARDVPPYRRIMPYIMPTRNESAVYFEQEIDLSRTLPFIEAFNQRGPRRISLFHVFLWAAIRALGERPRMNRFVSGGRIYERDGIWISYSAKKAMSDDAPIVVLKRRFDPTLSFRGLVEMLAADIGRGRSNEKSHVDKELSIVLRLPGPLLRWLTALQRRLDAWNLLPGAFIHNDPLYASLFVANLGSLKLDAPFHHLYEYGNTPLFAVIGRVRKIPVVAEGGQLAARSVCTLRYTFDERIEDGLYCAGALTFARGIIEDPQAAGAELPEAQPPAGPPRTAAS